MPACSASSHPIALILTLYRVSPIILKKHTVNRDYRSVIQFLNHMQCFTNLYAVDALSLASENTNQGPAGVIEVAMHLKTCFRTLS